MRRDRLGARGHVVAIDVKPGARTPRRGLRRMGSAARSRPRRPRGRPSPRVPRDRCRNRCRLGGETMGAAALAARIRLPVATRTDVSASHGLRFDELGGPLVAVCGLVGGSGASTLAYALARQAARESPVPVLLTEADARRAGLAVLAGQTTRLGLSDLAQRSGTGTPPATRSSNSRTACAWSRPLRGRSASQRRRSSTHCFAMHARPTASSSSTAAPPGRQHARSSTRPRTSSGRSPRAARPSRTPACSWQATRYRRPGGAAKSWSRSRSTAGRAPACEHSADSPATAANGSCSHRTRTPSRAASSPRPQPPSVARSQAWGTCCGGAGDPQFHSLLAGAEPRHRRAHVRWSCGALDRGLRRRGAADRDSTTRSGTALRLSFDGVERTPGEALRIALQNGRIATATLLCALAVRRLPERARAIVDVILAAVLVLNAAALGLALGAYGERLVVATAAHAPIELAALSLAGGAYVSARRQPVSPRALAAVASSQPRTARRGRDCRDLRLGRSIVKAPRGVRILVMALVCVPAVLFAWAYVSTHQLGRTWEELRDGRHVTWPPAPRPSTEAGPGHTIDATRRRRDDDAAPDCSGRAAARARRRRHPSAPSPAPGTTDDALGAAARPRRPRQPVPRPGGVRGHRRSDRQPLVRAHLAGLRPLRARGPSAAGSVDPVHRRRAARARPRDSRAAGGPLSRRRAHRGRRSPNLEQRGRAAQEAAPVRAVDPDHAQLRARLHRVARRPSVVARLRGHRAARAHAGARLRAPPRATAAQAARTRAAGRRQARPRRARHRLRRRSQGAQRRARAPTPLTRCTPTCG